MRNFCLFILLAPLLVIGLFSALLTALLVLGAFVTFDIHFLTEGLAGLFGDMSWLKVRAIWVIALVVAWIWWITEDMFR